MTDNPQERVAKMDLETAISIASVEAQSHDLAAESYFTIAQQSCRDNGDPSPTARAWYQRSLNHGKLAQSDFAISRAAYCIGIIDVAEGLQDAAAESFNTAREHAAKQGVAAGEAAALFQLSRLAMSNSEVEKAITYALESYVLSRNADQYGPAAATLYTLFNFYGEQGLDERAVEPALEAISELLGLLGANGSREEVALEFGTFVFAAISVLSGAAREQIRQGIKKQYGNRTAKLVMKRVEESSQS